MPNQGSAEGLADMDRYPTQDMSEYEAYAPTILSSDAELPISSQRRIGSTLESREGFAFQRKSTRTLGRVDKDLDRNTLSPVTCPVPDVVPSTSLTHSEDAHGSSTRPSV